MRYYYCVVATTTNLPWHQTPPPLLLQYSSLSQSQSQPRRLLHQSLHTHYSTIPRAFFGRSDFDAFAKRAASGDLLRDAWRSANDGFEQLLFETKKAAQRIDRRYSVSRRLSAVAQSAAARARELDRHLDLTQRWRNFTLDFSRNWPNYRKQFNDFLDSPLGRIFATVFFLWFALSGWMFRFFIFSVWILPFAGPLLIGTIANNFVIKGACPACKKQFVGYKNQVVRCTGCKNIVWQPQGDFFSRGSRGSSRRKSDPDIIDVEFEEK